MKAIRTYSVICALFAVVVACVASSIIGKPAFHFTAEDQFENAVSWDKYKGKNVVLLMSDRKGTEYIPTWTSALRKETGNKVDYVAFADVSSAPFFMKGFIRGKIKGKYTNQIILDWEGDIFEYYQCKEEVANVVFIDKSGTIRYTTSGKGESAEIQRAIEELRKVFSL